MPIYEYQCEACGNKLEKLQKLSDDPLEDCPECEKPELRKLVSAAVFRLKGAGWYETDFKTGDKKNVSGSDSSSKSDSDSANSARGGSSDGASGGSSDGSGGSSKKGDSSSASKSDSGSSTKSSTTKTTGSSAASN